MVRKQKSEKRIEVSSKVHFGKPCVAGTRIPVENVLELVQDGIPFDRIITEYYPDLDLEDIKACVKYAVEIVKNEEIRLDVAQE